MIEIVEYQDIQEHKDKLSSFALNKDILLVASLNDKLFWRNHYLQNTNLLTDETIQRASDFWRKLLLYIPENYKIVSAAFLKTFLTEYIDANKIELSADTLFRLLNEFQDIIYAEDLEDVFQEWAEQNVDQQAAWLQHVDILRDVLKILEEKKWVTTELLPALLYKYRYSILETIKHKNIYVSLNVSSSVLENKLLVSLAEVNTITFFLPIIEPINNFVWDYQIYKPLLEDSSLVHKSQILSALQQSMRLPSVLPNPKKGVEYYEFESIINEVRFVIQKIRTLLQQGHSSSQIAVLSVNKSRYSLLFDTFMQLEGLHSLSTQDSSVLGLKEIQYLIERLKLKLKQVEAESLEVTGFHQEADRSYTSFFKTYANIYNEEQAADFISQLNIVSVDAEQRLEKQQFLEWFFDTKTEIDVNPFTTILSDVPDAVHFKRSSWLQYLQRMLQKKFLRKSTIHDGVLQVLDILESSLHEDKHVFILGINEKDIKENQNAFVDAKTIESLATDLGFIVPSHFSQKRLMSLLFILQSNNHIQLSYSKFDATAEQLEHSIFHYLPNFKKEPLLDSLESYKSVDTHNAVVSNFMIHSLSATQIESYIRCPFIYYAKHILKLKDTSPLDVDIDPLTNGNVVHFTLCELVQIPLWPHVDDRVIIETLHQSIEHHKKDIKEDSLTPSYLQKTKEYILQFRDFEKDWRRQYPKTKTIALEKKITAHITTDGFFVTDPKDDSIPFTAKIDRIDTDSEGNYLIIDYKFKTSPDHTHLSTWLNKGTIQLALYSILLEDIKYFEDFKSVVGAVYFTLKPLQRKKGFLIKNHSSLYTVEGRSKIFIEEEYKQNCMQQIRDKVKASIQQMQKGYFQPQPLDKKQCEHCAWRDACRAPHLS